MANLVYTRVSTDEQSTQRQTHLLGEAGLTAGAEGVRLFSDPATSSKIPALEREGFQELAGYARPGDTLTVSELFRLCRDLATIVIEPEVVRVEMPGKVAQHLNDHDGLGVAEQRVLRQGRMVRRGQGYSLHITAAPQVHQALLAAAIALNAEGASSADRKAYRIYFDRLSNVSM